MLSYKAVGALHKASSHDRISKLIPDLIGIEQIENKKAAQGG
jgi:hypothetical protein